MFCPQCGSNQSEELKFCKLCGTNLQAVLQLITVQETGEKLDWSKTWVAEKSLSPRERKLRAWELELERNNAPEVKRYNEIKDGIITGCVGIGVAIFLFVLMQGIIIGGNVPPHIAQILSRLWVAGVIPLFVGIALLINGLFVSKRLVEVSLPASSSGLNILGKNTEPPALRSADTSEFIPAGFSVTEGTTKHLNTSSQKRQIPNNS